MREREREEGGGETHSAVACAADLPLIRVVAGRTGCLEEVLHDVKVILLVVASLRHELLGQHLCHGHHPPC